MLKNALAVSLVLGAVACGAPDATVSATEADVKTGKFCGGIANIQCPTGYECVDNPHDNCDPRRLAHLPGELPDHRLRRTAGRVQLHQPRFRRERLPEELRHAELQRQPALRSKP
jgi:hypothetical protein